MSNDEIATACGKIAETYKNDIDESELTEECQFVKTLFMQDSDKPLNLSHKSIYETLYRDGLFGTFPNLEILLRIYLCLFVSNTTDERSFSKLKYIKNYLRNTMGEDRLNSLALLSIESDILDKMNVEEIIDAFILAKKRKAPL